MGSLLRESFLRLIGTGIGILKTKPRLKEEDVGRGKRDRDEKGKTLEREPV